MASLFSDGDERAAGLVTTAAEGPGPQPLPCGSALSRVRPGRAMPFAGRNMPFEWTLNPYRGCAIGCGYCYARYSHAFLGLDDPVDFEKRVFWKEDLPRLLGRDLDRLVAPGQRIAMGTVTDPYQPLERRLEITRNCLRVFARRRGLRLSITTKADLVTRDLDLLRVVAARNSLHVNFTVTTLDRRLARALEPKATTPQRRLRALRTLAAEGIETGVFAMPVLPGLTDGPGALEDLAREAAAMGAKYLVHQCLFLREPTRSFWFARLRREWPALLERYEHLFPPVADARSSSPALEDLRESLARRVARARRACRLADGPSDPAPADPQMVLQFRA